jgi:hypothetical protein
MDYATLDKITALANDPHADPATRAIAVAQLAKASTSLVVTNGRKKSNWGTRAEERTRTIQVEEAAKRHDIGLEVERKTVSHAEAIQQIRHRIEKAPMIHDMEMANALDALEEAKLRLEEQRARRAKRRQEMGL